MENTSRRDTLKAIGAAVIATQARPILGANDRINLAVIGIGGRGTAHVNEYGKLDCHIAALCDVNQAAQERAVALVQKNNGHAPKVYSDMRKLFDDKDVHAVSIATPNHWHALATIWACQAGKDVYVEKPVCHNIFEGEQMIAAARKYNRMVQAGTQSRSSPHKMQAMKLLREGAIGKIYMAKGLCYKRRPSIGRKPDQPTPPGVDWSLFLGPAPMRAFNENRFKYNWHWFWDTGNGDIGNQGVHEMDVMLWGASVTKFPKSVVSTGGKMVYDDDQETPNTQISTFTHDGLELVFEVRGLVSPEEGPLRARGSNVVGNMFYGSDGYMAVDGAGFWLYKGEKRELAMEGKASRGENAPHMDNYLKAIRSRKREDLNAEVALNVLASDYCHLANISYRVGHSLAWDAQKKKFNDAAADAMISRKYRAPYIVPEKV
ncbi:MAG: Gfo/Idh/MocA family oxidoreductase [Candidatus Solibacter usitatus]|nr:Gfo/Idh/MocA family oxidoreductase [Candidatus Solibacter usitatus]